MSTGPEPLAETPAGSEVPTPASVTAAPEPAPPSRLARPEWRDLLSTIRRDLDHMRADHADSFEGPIPTDRTPTDGTPTDTDSTGSTATETTPAETLTLIPKIESPRRIRRRTAPAHAHDEWGVFDPQERGIAGMFVHVNEIAKEGKTRTKKTL